MSKRQSLSPYLFQGLGLPPFQKCSQWYREYEDAQADFGGSAVESRNGKQEEVILRWTIRSEYRVKCLNRDFNVIGRSQSISNTSKWSLELIVAAPRWPRRGPAIVDPRATPLSAMIGLYNVGSAGVTRSSSPFLVRTNGSAPLTPGNGLLLGAVCSWYFFPPGVAAVDNVVESSAVRAGDFCSEDECFMLVKVMV
jgi:hypothetical protein